MKILYPLVIALLALLVLAGCGGLRTATPQSATITVTLDLGGGRTGFAASIYA